MQANIYFIKQTNFFITAKICKEYVSEWWLYVVRPLLLPIESMRIPFQKFIIGNTDSNLCKKLLQNFVYII